MQYEDLLRINERNADLPPVTVSFPRIYSRTLPHCTIDIDNRYHMVSEIQQWVLQHKYYITNLSSIPSDAFNLSSSECVVTNRGTAAPNFSSIELWCEDMGSGQQFWSFICKELFPLIKVTHPICKDKHGNICWNADKLVEQLPMALSMHTNTLFIVALDIPTDNSKAVGHFATLDTLRQEHSNLVLLHGYLSFEYVLLTLSTIAEWLSVKKPLSFIEQRLIQYFRSCDWHDLTTIDILSTIKRDLEQLCHRDVHIMERLFAVLLNELTSQRGAFQVSKRRLRSCWTDDCCNRGCMHLTSVDKANFLFNNTELKQIFTAEGIIDAYNSFSTNAKGTSI